MNRKKIFIIFSVVIIFTALSLSVYYSFFYKKSVNILTEQDKIDILNQLTKESKDNFTPEQKIGVLKNLSNSVTSQKAAEITLEERMKIIQADTK